MERRKRMKKEKKEWRGDKARPSNRAKTWGRDKSPKQDRKKWNNNPIRDLLGGMRHGENVSLLLDSKRIGDISCLAFLKRPWFGTTTLR